jgi:hypothetical protein
MYVINFSGRSSLSVLPRAIEKSLHFFMGNIIKKISLRQRLREKESAFSQTLASIKKDERAMNE